ncbi:MAG: hypothetical protein GEU73_09025 [Chloroflexi bacterium]|nr:hypothetical protein [Chloroflexota bacterium]
MRSIRDGARRQGVTWAFDREGREHEIWRCGAQMVSIPRHREIREGLARRIMRDLEEQLGERWWQT